jgi:hypothetical protein
LFEARNRRDLPIAHRSCASNTSDRFSPLHAQALTNNFRDPHRTDGFIETWARLVLSNDDEYFSSAEISTRAAARSRNRERAVGSATHKTRA